MDFGFVQPFVFVVGSDLRRGLRCGTTDPPSTIQRIAHRELFIEDLFVDRFVLAANPPKMSTWGRVWQSFSLNQPVSAEAILELPFILPEANASRRQQFDQWLFYSTGQVANVILEAGGWQTILDFVESGFGVGFVSQSAIEMFRSAGGAKLNTRMLYQKEFPADSVRIIARKRHGKNEPDLSERGVALNDHLIAIASKMPQ